jgi:hypothetical protein
LPISIDPCAIKSKAPMIEAIAGMITAKRESPSIFLIPELYPSKRLEQLFIGGNSIKRVSSVAKTKQRLHS